MQGRQTREHCLPSMRMERCWSSAPTSQRRVQDGCGGAPKAATGSDVGQTQFDVIVLESCPAVQIEHPDIQTSAGGRHIQRDKRHAERQHPEAEYRQKPEYAAHHEQEAQQGAEAWWHMGVAPDAAAGRSSRRCAGSAHVCSSRSGCPDSPSDHAPDHHSGASWRSGWARRSRSGSIER